MSVINGIAIINGLGTVNGAGFINGIAPTGIAPPAAPTNLAAVGGTGSVSVTWTDSVGATSYNLRYGTDNATWTTVNGATSPYTDSLAKTTIGVTGIVYYEVQAVNAGGSSSFTSSVNVGLALATFSPLEWAKSTGTLFQDTAGTTPATADGDPVGRVNDAGGVPNNLTQATAGHRPLLKLAIQNGLQVIRADGSDDFLSNASASAFKAVHDGTGGTLLWAGKKTSADGTTTGLVGNASGTASEIGFSMFMANGNLFTLITNGGGTAVINKSVAVAQGTPFAAGFRFKTGASPAAFRIRVNGGADATLAATGSPSSSNATHGIGVFALSDSPTNFWMAGDFYELIILPTDLSDANMALLMTYINVRWGVF